MRIQYFILFCFWDIIFSTGLKIYYTPIHAQEQKTSAFTFIQSKKETSSHSSFSESEPCTFYIKTPIECNSRIEKVSQSTHKIDKNKKHYKSTSWYIKSNLVYDVLLMPSLEIEYRFDKNWSAAIESSIAWWHNDNKHKYYQLATIIPEVRWWFKPLNERHGHYLGVFGGGGWYDLENGGTGYKGTGYMIGISYGYMFPVGKYFAFEAGAGVGYLHTKYQEYYPIDEHYVYQQTSRTSFFGPLKLKFALVWKINYGLKKGGKK